VNLRKRRSLTATAVLLAKAGASLDITNTRGEVPLSYLSSEEDKADLERCVISSMFSKVAGIIGDKGDEGYVEIKEELEKRGEAIVAYQDPEKVGMLTLYSTANHVCTLRVASLYSTWLHLIRRIRSLSSFSLLITWM